MNSLFTTLLSFAFFYASTTNAQTCITEANGPVAICQGIVNADGSCCDCTPQGQGGDPTLCNGENCEEIPCPTTTAPPATTGTTGTTATTATTAPPATTLGVTATGAPCLCTTVLCPGSGSGSDSDSGSGSDSAYPCGSGSGSESDDSSEGSSDSSEFYVNATANATEEECICTTTTVAGSSSDSDSDSGGAVAGSGSKEFRRAFRGSGSSEFAALFNGDETVEDGAETATGAESESETVDLEINLSEDTLYHVWGMAALVIVANVVLCFVCYKRKNRAKVVVGDDDDDSKLNVMA